MPRRSRTINIGLEGAMELMHDLERLKKMPVGQEARKALLDGAEMIRAEAYQNAPIAPRPTYRQGTWINPGGLRESLKAAMGRQYKTFLQAFAFTIASLAPHAHLVEFGTKPHVIKPTKAKALRWFSRFRNGFKFGKQVNHGGAQPNKFFTKAIRSKRNRVKRHVERALKEAIETIARQKKAA